MTLALTNLANVLATPTEVFTRLKKQPRWFLAFVIISSVSIVAAWLLLPLSETVLVSMIGDKLDAEQARWIVSATHRLEYLSLILRPLILLIRWLIIASVVHFLSILLSTAWHVRFTSVYAVVVHSEVILLLMVVVNLVILYASGPDSMKSAMDLQAIVGLEFFLTDSSKNPALFTVLNSINLFSVWYVATLAIGTSVLTGFSKLKSSIISSTVWLLGVGVQVAFTAISAQTNFFPIQ